jgi:transcription-repair coupling factor (superfamily II helicase)
MFAEHGVKPEASADLAGFLAGNAKLALGIGPLHAGFTLEKLAFITETELFAGSPRRSRREAQKKASFDNWLKDLTELKVGDPVVHESHGIGRYQGLVRMDLGLGEQEFLELHYANDAKLFVPVAQLHVISRYSGADPDAAPLHTLGSGQWEKAKRKPPNRRTTPPPNCLPSTPRAPPVKVTPSTFQENDYEAFADGFGFEETNDQAAGHSGCHRRHALRQTDGPPGLRRCRLRQDRSRAARCLLRRGRRQAGRRTLPDHPALRTALPDLYRPLCRLAGKIAEISRFKTAKESALALQELTEGKIDIIIGTHKLIGKDVKFNRLGLVIIDEEHRFGVRQKETLKSMRAEVDVLTLTATPIPRTLAMSMEGLRDFSVIATAPQKRLAIKTFVSNFSDGIIREAVLRELKRGGQVYFLHNEVDTIANMQEKLTKLVPEARIVIGHGQMNERELERVMRDFTGQRANVLLCTTIIETGIDNPHANTILINRSEKFGLAQLHQLRGRVGRSHHQAYAYLLVQDEKALTKQAKMRLEAIQAMEELGSGFFLAMHDLEIRGAGEVLGDNQSGEMQEVGFNMYTDMLNRAVAALKQGKHLAAADLTQPLGIGTEINLRTPALLPDAYCPDVHERLTLYKRLANGETAEEIDALQEELIDRFGELPIQAQALLATHRLRLLVKPLCIQKLDAGTDQITLQFSPEFSKNPPIEPIKIINLIQKNRNYKLAGQDKISLLRHCATLSDKVTAVKDMIRQLTN